MPTSLYSYIIYYADKHKPFKFTSDPTYIETYQLHYRIICKTAHPEGTYRELTDDKDFIFTYIHGLRDPIRAYKPHRHCLNHYSNNPNYQASLYKPYYHRVLTGSQDHPNLYQAKGRGSSFCLAGEQ